jgi:hypothetical protein
MMVVLEGGPWDGRLYQVGECAYMGMEQRGEPLGHYYDAVTKAKNGAPLWRFWKKVDSTP